MNQKVISSSIFELILNRNGYKVNFNNNGAVDIVKRVQTNALLISLIPSILFLVGTITIVILDQKDDYVFLWMVLSSLIVLIGNLRFFFYAYGQRISLKNDQIVIVAKRKSRVYKIEDIDLFEIEAGDEESRPRLVMKNANGSTIPFMQFFNFNEKYESDDFEKACSFLNSRYKLTSAHKL